MTGTIDTLPLDERSILTNDGRVLHLEGPREGTPVLLIHGLGYASWAAEPLRRQLAPDIGLWSLDNPGTGRSEAHSALMRLETLAEDVALVIRTLGSPITVIGYSMGGYIAQLLAVAHPQLIDRLVLIGTSAGGPDSVPVPESTIRAWTDAEGCPPEEYARRTMPVSFRDGWTATHDREYDRLLDDRLRYPTSAETWRAQFEACERFLRDGYDTSALATTTLVIHGDADRVVPVENGRALAGTIPVAAYREVPNGGHLLHIEASALIADEIRSFLTPSRSPIHLTEE